MHAGNAKGRRTGGCGGAFAAAPRAVTGIHARLARADLPDLTYARAACSWLGGWGGVARVSDGGVAASCWLGRGSGERVQAGEKWDRRGGRVVRPGLGRECVLGVGGGGGGRGGPGGMGGWGGGGGGGGGWGPRG